MWLGEGGYLLKAFFDFWFLVFSCPARLLVCGGHKGRACVQGNQDANVQT